MRRKSTGKPWEMELTTEFDVCICTGFSQDDHLMPFFIVISSRFSGLARGQQEPIQAVGPMTVCRWLQVSARMVSWSSASAASFSSMAGSGWNRENQAPNAPGHPSLDLLTDSCLLGENLASYHSPVDLLRPGQNLCSASRSQVPSNASIAYAG